MTGELVYFDIPVPDARRAQAFYGGFEDIHAALERVRKLGGEAGEAQEIASGYMARCRDDQGTELNLWAPRGDS